jgi:hypothetical protein
MVLFPLPAVKFASSLANDGQCWFKLENIGKSKYAQIPVFSNSSLSSVCCSLRVPNVNEVEDLVVPM